MNQKPSQDIIDLIRVNLPSGALRKIEASTGIEYNLIHRTLYGIPVHWNETNAAVITEAVNLLDCSKAALAKIKKALAKTGKEA
jgi:hypothetical protein